VDIAWCLACERQTTNAYYTKPATKFAITIMLRRILLLLPFLLPIISFSQSDVEMADTFRSEGQIYVVIAVIAVIFIGLMIYLFMIERKILRIEKEIKNLPKR
jgi:hypothetical protein